MSYIVHVILMGVDVPALGELFAEEIVTEQVVEQEEIVTEQVVEQEEIVTEQGNLEENTATRQNKCKLHRSEA